MSRGLSSVVGVVVLLGVTVVAATTAGALVAVDDPGRVPAARLSLAADARAGEIALTHEGGETLDVTALDLTVSIDGTPLTDQPPVPFFAAPGFRGGPTGPFNRAADPRWTAGETATLRLASTNSPDLSVGARVTVLVRTEQGVVARLETTAR